MAGQWPGSTTAFSTANFDNDNDTVTGASGARADLLSIIQKLNVILAAVDPNSRIYTTNYKSTLAFKDEVNVFITRQQINNNLYINRDISTAEQNYLRLANVTGNQKWVVNIGSTSSGEKLIIKNKSNVNKLQLSQDCLLIDAGPLGIKYGSYDIATKPTKMTGTMPYDAKNEQMGQIQMNLGQGDPGFPDTIELRLRCLSAEYGYATGDIIHIPSNQVNNQPSNPTGLVIYKNGTLLKIRNARNGIGILRLSDGTVESATVNRWILEWELRWYN